MSKVLATPRPGKDFGKGVAAAKKAGGTFNGRCWEIPAALIERFKLDGETVEDYLRRNYLRPAASAAATAWTPAAMDAEDSIY